VYVEYTLAVYYSYDF